MSAKNVAFPGILAIKTAQALPATTTATLFTQSGGSVLVTGLFGLVTTAIGGTATSLALGTSVSNTAIMPSTAITSKAAGTWVVPQSASGVAAAPLTLAGGAAYLPASSYVATPLLLGSGCNITWTTTATDTGAISWYLWYIPIDADSGLS
jgi:hypothetical protein